MLSLTRSHVSISRDRATVRTSFRKNDQYCDHKKLMSFRRTNVDTCPVLVLQQCLDVLTKKDDDFIFTKIHKPQEQLQSETLQHNLRRQLQQAGSPILFSVMDLRRSAVSVYIANNLSFEVISSMLGWRGSDSVMFYNQVGRIKMADYSLLLQRDVEE